MSYCVGNKAIHGNVNAYIQADVEAGLADVERFRASHIGP